MNEPEIGGGHKPADREAASETPNSTATPRGHAPLSALRGERERRQAAERALADLRRQPGAEEPADPFTTLNTKLHDSEARARSRFGHETMDQVQAWTAARMKNDPAFARAVLSHVDPYFFAHHCHVQATAEGSEADPSLNEAPSGDDHRPTTDRSDKSRPETIFQPLHTPSPSPPRSLVSAPSAGGVAHTPQGPGQAFDALFKG